jgi:hypothetical protein
MMELKEWMQQAFNKAYLGLIAQGRPSKSEGTCLYRGPGSTCCAVGMLIDDADYLERFEAKNVSMLMQDYDLKDGFRRALNLPELADSDDEYALTEMLQGMQSAHDDSSSYGGDAEWLKQFRFNMVAVAKEHGLELPEVPNA